MIYFKGDPNAGDIEYVTRPPGSEKFSNPIPVNSQPRSASAAGTVHGAQMALGRNGRVYVAWFASSKADDSHGAGGQATVLFSRLDDTGTAFEPQRSTVQSPKGIDWGGLSVAADRDGNVYVFWHGAGTRPGDAQGRVYLARSTDDGRTFAREVPISEASLGACACCGMRSLVDRRGTLFVLYRAAGKDVHRDMTLLVSGDRGRTFRSRVVDSWLLNACPVSAASLSEENGRVLAAWETAGDVHFDEIESAPLRLSPTRHPRGEARNRRYPAVSANERSWVLLAWTEGTGWMKGGSLAWQLFDPAGRPAGPEGRVSGVPVWDLPSVFTDPQGNFAIAY
jgi:hypothetical protein